MKTITPPRTGKILDHARGTGGPSASDVRRRAQEIALIAGHAKATATDRAQARRELRGDAIPPTGDIQAESRRAVSRDPSEPPSIRGEEKPGYEAADEQKAAERLVLEGVEEAQHEQMLADRRRRLPE